MITFFKYRVSIIVNAVKQFEAQCGSQTRQFVSSPCMNKERAKNLKGSSGEWMTRHINDPYVKMLRYKNYRARSAFKLIEIDDKCHLLKPGTRVIDCGAAPGSWTQVAVERCNSNAKDKDKPTGQVIAIDLLHVNPIEGAKIFSSFDITKPETKELIYKELNGTKVNLVMSDMAPNASGVRELDQDLITKLCLEALRLSLATLIDGGSFLTKTWDGREIKKLETTIALYFKNVKRLKPKASRVDSAEIYLLGTNFIGLESKNTN